MDRHLVPTKAVCANCDIEIRKGLPHQRAANLVHQMGCQKVPLMVQLLEVSLVQWSVPEIPSGR
eukprot:scaffold8857_cov318-Chaetoceros_neogracile.AAC.1